MLNSSRNGKRIFCAEIIERRWAGFLGEGLDWVDRSKGILLVGVGGYGGVVAFES